MEPRTAEEAFNAELIIWEDLSRRLVSYFELKRRSSFAADVCVLKAQESVEAEMTRLETIRSKKRQLAEQEKRNLNAVEEETSKHGRDRSQYQVLPPANDEKKKKKKKVHKNLD
ncbi:unnamed protein product [Bursaphelenchus okinawaensis]|uniref:Uncharacterized protein n=1 Tax=Bursaphelenchus okinawaensis TaxID=465554 RepID=A0A811KLQ8_9BILA|nr:unnamed protein product [Bursaphelenchus okinawaensis]CAG9107543.1 unnamed protein product [Bursaphelenchus okinawaensis]